MLYLSIYTIAMEDMDVDAVEPPTAILYQNTDRDITLIDIPTSIAVAQGRSDSLLSTVPLHSPLSMKEEPRSSKAVKNTSKHFTNPNVSADYKDAIRAALTEIRSHVPGAWCAPRKFTIPVPKTREKKLQEDDPERELEDRLKEWCALGESKGTHDKAFDFQKMMASLGATDEQPATANDAVAREWYASYHLPRAPRDATQGSASDQPEDDECDGAAVEELWTASLHNPCDRPLELCVRRNEVAQTDREADEYRFTIPPRATFFLGDVTQPDSFRAAFRDLTDEHSLPRHFNLVVLDPPWPNRSSKRTHAYEQMGGSGGGMPYVKRLLLGMNLDNYLESDALVGIWITNKEGLRNHVLGPGGLFEAWGVGLIEEWIWVKTTVRGEPMFDLASAVRKPYEVLLLGRAAPNSWTTVSHVPMPKKRVVAAVPNMHSQKPCLKELLEPYMPDAQDYSALEVFSRHLVSGWTSWGNEVIKFNWDKYWASDP